MTSGDSDIRIRKATTLDVDAIKGLADNHRHELGFVRRPALIEAIGRQEVLVAEEGSGIVGFAEYHHRRDAQTTLYHVAVHPEWRKRNAGRLLVSALRDESAVLGKQIIQLKCPSDLPANAFYRRLGFQLANQENGRGRALNVWTLGLLPPS